MNIHYWSLLGLLLLGCSHAEKQVSIIHDYVLLKGVKACTNHGELHYIVSTRNIEGKGERDTYPCTDTYKFRCQDGILITFDSGTQYCFISQAQLKESL